MPIVSVFCDVDDFCITFEALFEFQTAELSFAEKISHCQHRP